MRLKSESWLRPVCGGLHNIIRFNCTPFFTSRRRHRVLTHAGVRPILAFTTDVPLLRAFYCYVFVGNVYSLLSGEDLVPEPQDEVEAQQEGTAGSQSKG